METAGTILKNEREKQNLSLREIALGIKIKIEYLASIENDDYDSLPAEIFTKSYIRMYAEILGIDGRPLIELYKKQIEPPEPEVTETKRTFDISSYKNIAIVIAIAITSAIIIFNNEKDAPDITKSDISKSTPSKITKEDKNKLDAIKTESTIIISAPDKKVTLDTEKPKNIQGKFEDPAEITDKKPLTAINSNEIERKADVPSGIPAVKQPEVKEIEKEQPVTYNAAADKDKKEMEPAAEIASDIKKSPAADDKKMPSLDSSRENTNKEEKITTGKKQLKVTAMEMTWVAISIDDGKTKEWFLRAGESITLTADEKFIVKTGNAGGTKLFLDDREIDAIGPHGKVAEIVLP